MKKIICIILLSFLIMSFLNGCSQTTLIIMDPYTSSKSSLEKNLSLIETNQILLFLQKWGQLILLLVSILIAVIALFFTYSQISIQRKHNILSVKPLLELRYLVRSDELTIFAINNGFGPSIITSVKYKLSDIENSNLPELVNSLINRNMVYIKSKPIEEEQIIKSGGQIDLMSVGKTKNIKSEKEFDSYFSNLLLKLSSLEFDFEYTDIYRSETFSLKAGMVDIHEHWKKYVKAWPLRTKNKK